MTEAGGRQLMDGCGEGEDREALLEALVPPRP
jgi:hypothetical protein